MEKIQWFRYTEKTASKIVSWLLQAFSIMTRCRFLVGNPSTGGYGLTLTAARNVIYFSNSYNLEVRKQSEDRAHRIGQKNKVSLY